MSKKRIVILVLVLFIFLTSFLIIRDITSSSYLSNKGNDTKKKVDDNKAKGPLKVALIDAGIASVNSEKIIQSYNVLDESENISDSAARTDIFYNTLLKSEKDIQLINIKAFDSVSKIDEKNVAKAINYACDNGANIVNLGFSTKEDKDIEAAITKCNSKKITVVAQAKRKGTEFLFPGNLDSVISVARKDDAMEADILVDTTMQIGCKSDKCEIKDNASLSTFLASLYLVQFKDKNKESSIILKPNTMETKAKKEYIPIPKDTNKNDLN
ncbi:MAG: hypothetical protein RR543_03220 [Erysipelotrichales bacterium]